jgi:DNA-binding HxlR family transcriptional regulator
VIDARPPLVEYRLTDRGEELKSLVDALARFAQTAYGAS